MSLTVSDCEVGSRQSRRPSASSTRASLHPCTSIFDCAPLLVVDSRQPAFADLAPGVPGLARHRADRQPLACRDLREGCRGKMELKSRRAVRRVKRRRKEKALRCLDPTRHLLPPTRSRSAVICSLWSDASSSPSLVSPHSFLDVTRGRRSAY